MKVLSLLGLKVIDKITNFEGIVTSVSFDLYGCIQLLVQPISYDGQKAETSYWFDENRMKITCKIPVMKPPDFVKNKGPAFKPTKM